MIPIKDDQQRYSAPVINYLLIATNIFVFLLEQSFTKRQLDQLALIPAHLWPPHASALAVITPFFTNMFLHAARRSVYVRVLVLRARGGNLLHYPGRFKHLVFCLAARWGAAAEEGAGEAPWAVPVVGGRGGVAGV